MTCGREQTTFIASTLQHMQRDALKHVLHVSMAVCCACIAVLCVCCPCCAVQPPDCTALQESGLHWLYTDSAHRMYTPLLLYRANSALLWAIPTALR
jgi:hypothetical protein